VSESRSGQKGRTIPRGLSKRYAAALLNAALKANIAEQVAEEAESLQETFRQNPDFRDFLVSPQNLVAEKKSVIDAVLKGRASDLLVRLLALLVDKKRINLVDEIAEAYVQAYEKHMGIVEATVITAIDIDSAVKDKVRTKIEGDTGKKIRLNAKVDPAIIGGMVLVIEDKIIDGSVRYEIERIKRELKGIRVS